eukprot:13028650-Alexandrium_andersonii.AAC.1
MTICFVAGGSVSANHGPESRVRGRFIHMHRTAPHRTQSFTFVARSRREWRAVDLQPLDSHGRRQCASKEGAGTLTTA